MIRKLKCTFWEFSLIWISSDKHTKSLCRYVNNLSSHDLHARACSLPANSETDIPAISSQTLEMSRGGGKDSWGPLAQCPDMSSKASQCNGWTFAWNGWPGCLATAGWPGSNADDAIIATGTCSCPVDFAIKI